ncbi:hypothetical protein OG520_40530 (plasmid) [Streptomyces sp. NBC_00984]|uniref:hypothetical protein n=1 Tax=Streptomyces sp. NBC_00984 TaxID=2903700 RepID=UPI002F9067E4|nr:hypothetical protein OG520_40530 [Streptomyces sp. NBC_00984]
MRCNVRGRRALGTACREKGTREWEGGASAHPHWFRRLRAALAAFHALTSGQLRSLKTTDLRDGRLFLPNRTVLLADLVRTRLAACLDY